MIEEEEKRRIEMKRGQKEAGKKEIEEIKKGKKANQNKVELKKEG